MQILAATFDSPFANGHFQIYLSTENSDRINTYSNVKVHVMCNVTQSI